MAEFVGAHVEMGVSVKTGNSELFYPIWSETIAPGGTTEQKAAGKPALSSLTLGGVLVFRVRAHSAGPIFGARGAEPDATKAKSTSTANTRMHLLANELRDIPAVPGDKFTIVAAV